MTEKTPISFVLLSVMALILGFTVLLAGNGLQFAALGLRASIEGFSVQVMGWINAGYFVGFGIGSLICPAIVISSASTSSIRWCSLSRC